MCQRNCVNFQLFFYNLTISYLDLIYINALEETGQSKQSLQIFCNQRGRDDNCCKPPTATWRGPQSRRSNLRLVDVKNRSDFQIWRNTAPRATRSVCVRGGRPPFAPLLIYENLDLIELLTEDCVTKDRELLRVGNSRDIPLGFSDRLKGAPDIPGCDCWGRVSNVPVGRPIGFDLVVCALTGGFIFFPIGRFAGMLREIFSRFSRWDKSDGGRISGKTWSEKSSASE